MRVHVLGMAMAAALAMSACVDDNDANPGGEGAAGGGEGEAEPLASGAQLAACIGLDEGAACALGELDAICEIFPNGVGCGIEVAGAGVMPPPDGGVGGVGGMGGMGGGPPPEVGEGGMGGGPPPEGGEGGMGGAMMPSPPPSRPAPRRS